MSDIPQRLHDSEINFSIACFFDGCWTARLGDEMNGFDQEATVGNYAEALAWLDKAAREKYPNSFYATGKYPASYHPIEGGALG